MKEFHRMSTPESISHAQIRVLPVGANRGQSSEKVAGKVSGGVSATLDAKESAIGGTEMREMVIQRIRNLPPLPKTIADVYALRGSDDFHRDALVKIIQTDPMISANLLKISNSAIYGRPGQVKTVSGAIEMLGDKMAINAVICASIGGHLKSDLSPYGTDIQAFTVTSSLQSTIIERWSDPKLSQIQTDLQFAAFLQEVGVLVASKVAIEKNLVQSLKRSLAEEPEQSAAEEAVFGLSSAPVTALMFSEWKFNDKLIGYIEGADHPELAPSEVVVGSQALKIVKTLAPLGKPAFTEEAVSAAVELVKKYGFDEAVFRRTVDRIVLKLEGG